LILLADPKWGADLVSCILYTKAVACLSAVLGFLVQSVTG